MQTPGQRFGLAGFLVLAGLIVVAGLLAAFGGSLRDLLEDLRSEE